MRVAITGGPGVGKTALLHELRARGFATVEETARAIIRSRRAQGLSARSSSLEFAEQVLQCDIERYEQNGNEGLAFFDRGVLDALAMIVEAAPPRRAEVAALAANYSYHRVAFFLPPWEQIYVNDEERDQSFTDAVRVHDSLVAWYELCGYRIATVPTVSVAERCNYVLSALSASDAQPIAASNLLQRASPASAGG